MIVSAVIHDGPRAMVRWDAEAGDPTDGTVTVSRRVGSGPVEPVQGWVGAPMGSGVATDWAVPLNVPVVYALTHSSGEIWRAEAVTAVSDRPQLIETVRGGRAVVTVKAWPEYATPNQTRSLSVPRRRDRLILSGIEETPVSNLELLTFTAAELAAVEALLADGNPVLLKGWGPVTDTWVSVKGRDTRRFAGASETRVIALEVDHLAGPPDPAARGVANTLGDLHDFMQAQPEGPTLAGINARWPGSLLDIAADPLGGEG